MFSCSQYQQGANASYSGDYQNGKLTEAPLLILCLLINIHTANLRPTKSLGVRETESMAVGD